jgi:hypothetical protein
VIGKWKKDAAFPIDYRVALSPGLRPSGVSPEKEGPWSEQTRSRQVSMSSKIVDAPGLAEKVRALRNQGKTQEQIAVELRIAQSTVSVILRSSLLPAAVPGGSPEGGRQERQSGLGSRVAPEGARREAGAATRRT